MAEALPDVARFNGALERKRLASSSGQRLVGSVLRVAHSIPVKPLNPEGFSPLWIQPSQTGSD